MASHALLTGACLIPDDAPLDEHAGQRKAQESIAECDLESIVVQSEISSVTHYGHAKRLCSGVVVFLLIFMVMFGFTRNGKDLQRTSSLSFIGRSEAAHTDIAENIKNHACLAGSWVVGFFKTAETCAHHVKASGGKFFEFGNNFNGYLPFGKQACVIKFAESDSAANCPEGSVHLPNTDYYKVKGMPDEGVIYCRADLVKVAYYKHQGNKDVFIPNATGFVHKEMFSDMSKPFILMSGINTMPVMASLGMKKKVCNAEYVLECVARHAKVSLRERCCETFSWNPDCIPGSLDTLHDLVETETDKSIKWLGALAHRGDYVDVCPTKSPKVNIGLGPNAIQDACITLQLTQRTVTLGEQMDSCATFASAITTAFQSNNYMNRLWNIFFPDTASTLSLDPKRSDLNPFVFDVFTISMVALSNFLAGMAKRTTVPIPTAQGFADRSLIFTTVGTPRYDIDQDTFQGQNSLYCAIEAFRMFALEDALDRPVENQWVPLLVGHAHPNGTKLAELKVACPDMLRKCTMKQFVQGVFYGYKTGDGDPTWPTQVIDFDQFRRPDGSWHDDAEKFLAFGHIGSHRLQRSGDHFVLDSLALKDIAMRPGFEQLGAKMFFSLDGDPVMVETPTGERIDKSSNDWQYWKFCWRSSMVLYITLVDHLWLSHLAFANDLSAASRETLPSAHPLRRLIAVFTYDSIKVNDMLTHQLLGPDQLLQRAIGAADYYEVQRMALRELPAASDIFVDFFDTQKLRALEDTIKNTPFFQDGAWLFETLELFVSHYMDIFRDDWCDIQGFIKDKNILWFIERSHSWSLIPEHEREQHVVIGLRLSPDGPPHCSGLKKYLTLRLFAVTGYHRHVSQVYDMLSIPDFVTFSWKKGEHSGRPQQHMNAVLMFASTAGVISPNKLASDYSYIAEGMTSHSVEAQAAFKTLSSSMVDVKKKIDENNRGRTNPYLHMHPDYVDTSVSM